jgi:molybdopterin/thiamine biosynthesis adenylyltransferase
MPSSDRDIRQRELVPPARLANCHAVVIGVGAIGRQVALQLSALGVPELTLYDHDTVAIENLAPQGFWESDLGRTKVEAVADIARKQFPAIELTGVPERFRASMVRSWPASREFAVFCCVDAIDTRKLIWQAVRDAAGFFADGRMAAEVIRVLASGEPAADHTYVKTLFPGAEAYQESCTARSTIYASNIAAGLMVAQFAHWLRGLPVVPDQMLNLLAAEYHAVDCTG